MNEQEPYSIEWHKGFQMGLYSGKTTERERILEWIEDHRQSFEIVEGVEIYRDRFDSESLVAFIKGETK